VWPYTKIRDGQVTFEFGYRNRDGETRWMQQRQSDDEIFVARFGRAERDAKSFREANRWAADFVFTSCAEASLIPTLFYSGGLDSEIAFTALLEAAETLPQAHRLDVVVMRWLTPTGEEINSADLADARRFLKLSQERTKSSDTKLEICARELDFQLLEYWRSADLLADADQDQIVSPQLLALLRGIDRHRQESPQSCPIIAQGEAHYKKSGPEREEYEPSLWRLMESERLCGLFRHFLRRQEPAFPSFFQILPEQFAAQLRLNPILHQLFQHQRYGKMGTRTSKPLILAHDYPELAARVKLHGFEAVQGEHDQWRQVLAERLPNCDQNFAIAFYDLYQQLRPVREWRPSTWIAGWGLDDELTDRRLHADQIFFTEAPLTSPEIHIASIAWQPDAPRALPDSTWMMQQFLEFDLGTAETLAAAWRSQLLTCGHFVVLPHWSQVQSSSAKASPNSHQLIHDSENLARWLSFIKARHLDITLHPPQADASQKIDEAWSELLAHTQAFLYSIGVRSRSAQRCVRLDPDYAAIPPLVKHPHAWKAPLREVPHAEWLTAFRQAVPDAVLGANVFGARSISGRASARRDLRISLAWQPPEMNQPSSWVHLIAQTPERLRIRGFVTHPRYRGQGHMTQMLSALLEQLAHIASPSYREIEIFAWVETAQFYKQRGFVVDETFGIRDEEIAADCARPPRRMQRLTLQLRAKLGL
jgi:GNAT superfamily N-acetyltransferase